MSKLPKQIENKLAKLSQLIDQIDEAHAINSDDPDTWDADTLYDLVENLKAALELLEDKLAKGQYDDFAEPIILETGLCSLVDDWEAEKEAKE